MAQGTYRCMKILYGPRGVQMHVNPIWPKGRIDAWKSYMAQGTYIVYIHPLGNTIDTWKSCIAQGAYRCAWKSSIVLGMNRSVKAWVVSKVLLIFNNKLHESVIFLNKQGFGLVVSFCIFWAYKPVVAKNILLKCFVTIYVTAFVNSCGSLTPPGHSRGRKSKQAK